MASGAGVLVGSVLVLAGSSFAGYGWPRRVIRQYRMAALNGIAVVVVGVLVVLITLLRA